MGKDCNGAPHLGGRKIRSKKYRKDVFAGENR